MKTRPKHFVRIFAGIVLAATFLVVYSCSQETVVDNPENFEVVAVKGGKDVTRPVRITLEGIDNDDGPGATMWGKMTHLGNVTGPVAEGEVYDENPGGFSFRTLPGLKDVIIASNGDEVWSTGDLTFVFVSQTSAIYSGTITFIGGTGRFEEASGSMYIENGVYDIIGFKADGVTFKGVFSHVGNGEITY